MSTLVVGCGCKEYPDADVYLDLYPSDSKERKANSGNIVVPKGKKFVQGDVQNMKMFKDKEFKYVIAEHILEHVEYPEAACHELQRVAKAGLIKTPTAFAEIFFGWEYHRWLVLDRNKELYFFQKREYEKIPFNRFFKESNGKNDRYFKKIIPEIKKVYDTNKLLFDVIFEWKDNFKYHIMREYG